MALKQKKTPERLCLGCQTVKPKKELVRIVRSPEGGYSADPTGKKPGRGAYICASAECFDSAAKKGQFARSFKAEVPKDVIERLRAELFGEGGEPA